MNANEVLADILHHACPESVSDDGVYTFRITTHCAEWVLTARSNGVYSYNILTATLEAE